MAVGYLSLGSNVGDRRANLCAAISELEERGVVVGSASSIYETEPVGEITDQPDFYNACVQVQTDLGPEQLLAVCKGVESSVGRDPNTKRHGPRLIDIDLLWLDDQTYHSDRLTLPHPGVSKRRFVLIPLQELDSEIQVPGLGTITDLLNRLARDDRVSKVGPLSP